MKPEIYYDQKRRDLVWLPKHSKIIAEVAEELYQSGTHYDSVIRGIGEPRKLRLTPAYVAWSCYSPEPLLNHPKIKEILMSKFKIGDSVTIRQLPSMGYNNLEMYQSSIGTIELDHARDNKNWRAVRWPDGQLRGVQVKDLILIKEQTMSRTIPSKDQVLKAATSCPQTKEALEILFPQDFEPEPIKNIFEHFAVIKGAVLMSPQVEEKLKRGLWSAKNGPRGPRELLAHPMFVGWVGISISGEGFKNLISDILALSER